MLWHLNPCVSLGALALLSHEVGLGHFLLLLELWFLFLVDSFFKKVGKVFVRGILGSRLRLPDVFAFVLLGLCILGNLALSTDSFFLWQVRSLFIILVLLVVRANLTEGAE